MSRSGGMGFGKLVIAAVRLLLVSGVVLGQVLPLHADWKESLDGAVEATRSLGEKAVERTRDLIGQGESPSGRESPDGGVADGSREIAPARGDGSDISPGQGVGKEGTGAGRREEFSELWGRMVGRLDAARGVYDELEKAPDSSWLGGDRSSLREDFNDILDEIVILADDGRVGEYRRDIQALRKEIRESQEEIRQAREAMVAAPREHPVKKTRSAFEAEIRDARSRIAAREREVAAIIARFAEALRRSGLELTPEQLTILLSRIDSADILRMVVVFDLLKDIHAQLTTLMVEAGSDGESSRRYYGMHVVLLEAVVFIQERYIREVEGRHLVKLGDLAQATTRLQGETRRALAGEADSRRRAVYETNLKAQDLTLKTVELYTRMLGRQRDKVVLAKGNAEKDLRLAANTYATVRISAELLQLIQESGKVYDALIALQVPEIVPFDNGEMARRFEEISQELSP
ncbi:MAG: hypothetical protein HQL57_09335 [Magnetococcales bacterium]|nr:hypothetical protein [Magnetococcales bacterium]